MDTMYCTLWKGFGNTWLQSYSFLDMLVVVIALSLSSFGQELVHIAQPSSVFSLFFVMYQSKQVVAHASIDSP